ncbi:DNA-processing protein DprA [Thalassotalea sp. PS06]|uniref:DNA-processing protein DprA n=1 Tax=Thalassotalea sp. PS06 TaxID=2594005 RepID=UPI00116272B6|nr:DNA-processing protein DprA [Thalassotalea sp. PS06]QDO99886.1 DNA-protecting protein DprA [Thalassotalea sp. PS06]
MPNDTLYWLALHTLTGITTQQKLLLTEKYSIQQLFTLDSSELSSLGLSYRQASGLSVNQLNQAEHILEQCEQLGISCVAYSDSDYPVLLQQIPDPPLLLFVQGNPDLLKTPQVAIVGPRMASYSAVDHAKEFAQGLIEAGFTITSGMALGIDSAAHQGALRCHGNTIAVVATGLEQVYPKRNRPLATQILENNGAIVSEYVPGTPPRAGHFPKRNRIITGLSLATLVIEAALKSGSLISARLAMEQNREVFAVPGSINNPNARGCHQLIKSGAHLAESNEDITSVLTTFTSNLQAQKKSKKIKKIESQDLFLDPLLASVDYEATPADVVASRCKLPVEEVLTRLTILELRGLVVAVPGGFLKQK